MEKFNMIFTLSYVVLVEKIPSPQANLKKEKEGKKKKTQEGKKNSCYKHIDLPDQTRDRDGYVNPKATSFLSKRPLWLAVPQSYIQQSLPV